MKIQITQANLNRALGLLSRVASSRTPLPILANILLEASQNSLTLSATNLEVALSHTTSGKIDEEGRVTVPARLLSDFVAQLPKDLTVELVFEESKLFIKAGSYSSHIQGTPPDDFPALPTIAKGATFNIPTSQLKEALERTILAASNDETRPVLGGVYFHQYEGSIYIAATDGYRLAESKLIDATDEIQAIVPVPALQDALKIIQDATEDTALLQFGEGQFGVQAGDSQLVSRLIDGQYPEYQQLIPDTSDISFTINKQEFVTAAKLAGLFARESGGSVTVSASDAANTVTVSSIASQVGDNSSVIAADVSGSGDVVLNVRYITDALGAFDTNQVSFRFSGSISPCVITSPDQPGYQHIVMPIKS